MSNYYNMEKSKVNLSRALEVNGWKIYGYHPDESDSMTDYYCPASWNGIAKKGDFIFVCDNKSAYYSSYKRVTRIYNKNALQVTERDQRRLESLKNVTVERGASEQEAETAQKAIKEIESRLGTTATYTEKVEEVFPEYKANPDNYNWHIQDTKGNIIAMGRGLTGFDFYTWQWDFENKKAERDREELEAKTTALYDLVDKIEKAIKNPKTMLINQGKKVEKTCIKPVKQDRKNIQVGDVLSFSYHGHYWKVVSSFESKNKKGEALTCFTYELLGSEKRGYQKLNGTSAKRYYSTESELSKGIQEGRIVIYKLEEVTETENKDKWVKVAYINYKEENTSNMITSEDAPQEAPETTETANYEFTIIEDTDTRDDSRIYVVKCNNKLDRAEYITLNNYIKSIGGYYSKFKHGFIFKENPKDLLKAEAIESKQEQQTEPKQEAPEPEEKLYYTHNTSMKTLEVTGENLKTETIQKLKAIGFVYLKGIKKYIADFSQGNRDLLIDNFSIIINNVDGVAS